jgi:S1-C subfamily serine protease
MKKHVIVFLAILSLGQIPFVAPAIAQNPRVTIPDFADLVERASPAVVNIRTTEKVMVQQQGGIPGIPQKIKQNFSVASLVCLFQAFRMDQNNHNRILGSLKKLSAALAQVSLLSRTV